MPRHISAILDNLVAIFAAVIAAKQLPDSMPIPQITLMVTVYHAYYLFFESLFSSTPGKLLNGLVVRNYSGGRPSIRQTVIRTLFRLVEVNPILLGGLPAAARIVWSQDKQRFGDLVAKTVVVFR